MLDLRCYMVTSGSGSATIARAAAAARAGCGIIQVREKTLSTRDLVAFTRALAEEVRRARPATRVVVDDRCDVAYAVRRAGGHVHGVHLGASDLDPADARAMLGADAIIGYTTGTLALVREARAFGELIDYVGAGPMRPTPTKDSGRAPIGVGGYAQLVAASAVPLVAIGDVRVGDVRALARQGVAGVALVREYLRAADAGDLTARILEEFDAAAGEA